MGDDEGLPGLISKAISRGSGSAATGGTVNNFFSGLSGGGQLFVVVASCLALGLSVGAVLMMAWGQQSMREQMADKIEAAERRWMDRVSLAERESRIARDEIERLKVAHKINTNH